MRECGKHEITIEKLIDVVHSYTDPIRIKVIMGDAFLTCEEARGTRKLHDFYLIMSLREHTENGDDGFRIMSLGYIKGVTELAKAFKEVLKA